VPFRGDAGAVTGLLTKNVDAIVAPATAVLGNIQGGKFRALAITGKERWPALKEVPTVAETVSSEFEMIAWIGVATTHGTPKPIIDRLNFELRRVIACRPWTNSCAISAASPLAARLSRPPSASGLRSHAGKTL
jgi:tripartite-type tricarboxylate transporter receptor subunit TctC